MTDENRDRERSEEELWARLEGVTGSERAEVLLDIYAQTVGDVERRLTLSEAAAVAAEDVSNSLLTMRARSNCGVCLYELDRFVESAEQHLLAAHAAEQLDNVSDIGFHYLMAAWSWHEAGELQRALDCVDMSVALLEQTDERGQIGDAHNRRAAILQSMGVASATVLEELSTARSHYRAVGRENVEPVLAMDERAADIFLDLGDHDAAINLLRDCLAVAESLSEERAAYFAYALGRALRLKGDGTSALVHLQRSYEFNLQQHDIADLGHVLFEIALAHWRLNNADEAFAAIDRARAHFDVVGNDEMVLDCDQTRAIWLHGVDRFAEAAEINERLEQVSSGWRAFMARARHADNLRCAEDYAGAVALAEPREVEAEFVGRSAWFWRECIRALAMSGLGRGEEAWVIAEHCLDMTEITEATNYVQGTFHELRGDKLDAEGAHEQARTEWAHAVALYLVSGDHQAAARLSRAFLPEDTAAPEQ